MRILVLSFYFEPDLCAGSFRATALVRALQKAGSKKIDVLTTMPNRYHGFSAQAKTYEEGDGIFIRRVELPSHQSGLVDQIRCFKVYADTVIKEVQVGQYDLVFATSSRLMTAWLGARVARKVKSPLYLDIRDIFADTVKDVFSGWKGSILFPLLSMVERWTIRRADVVNIVSEGFRPYFEDRYGSLPLRVFTNGVDDEFLDFQFKKMSPKKESTPINVLYAGNIGEGQGLEHIVGPLAERLGDKVNFTIVGGGGRRKQLHDSIQGFENVELLPPVNRTELIKLYEQADVLFLHLNDYNAFLKVLPSKLFEYAATGKPILAGIAGYASNFTRTEIENAQVFAPCDVDGGFQAFKALLLEYTDRDQFKSKYARRNIMQQMAHDILSNEY